MAKRSNIVTKGAGKDLKISKHQFTAAAKSVDPALAALFQSTVRATRKNHLCQIQRMLLTIP